MGGVESILDDEIKETYEEDSSAFENWGPTQHNNLHKLYLARNLDFTITAQELTLLIQDSIPSTSVNNSSITRLLEMFAPKSSSTEMNKQNIDILSLLTTVTVSSKCLTIRAKLAQTFNLFDFQSQNRLTYDETFIMLTTILSCFKRLTRSGAEPEDDEIERTIDEIFLSSDIDVSTGKVSVDDIYNWVKSDFKLGVGKGELVFVSLVKFMVMVGLLEKWEEEELDKIGGICCWDGRRKEKK